MLVNLGLEPQLPLRIEYKDVIHDAFFAVALTPAKYYEKLAKLGGRVAVSGAWGRPIHPTCLRCRLLLTAVRPRWVIASGSRLGNITLQTHIGAIGTST